MIIPPFVEIHPRSGSRNGWRYSTWSRFGVCRSARPESDGSARRYGIYGIRQIRKVNHWAELFVQNEGAILSDGSIRGVSLLSSSADLEPYFWCAAQHFTDIQIFGELL